MLLAVILSHAVSLDMAPVDIYKRAIETMRSIQAPAYLEYQGEEDTTQHGKMAVRRFHAIEQTSDRTAIELDSGDTSATSRKERPPIVPDMFLGHSTQSMPDVDSHVLVLGAETQPNSGLKTIATVVSSSPVPYEVTTVGSEDIAGCGGNAIHLKLQPLTRPLVYNLRDVWVNPASSQVCKAIAIWNAPVGLTRQNVSVTLDVNNDGFIYHWSLSATAHYILGAYGIEQEASYTDISAVSASEWAALK